MPKSCWLGLEKNCWLLTRKRSLASCQKLGARFPPPGGGCLHFSNEARWKGISVCVVGGLRGLQKGDWLGLENATDSDLQVVAGWLADTKEDMTPWGRWGAFTSQTRPCPQPLPGKVVQGVHVRHLVPVVDLRDRSQTTGWPIGSADHVSKKLMKHNKK